MPSQYTEDFNNMLLAGLSYKTEERISLEDLYKRCVQFLDDETYHPTEFPPTYTTRGNSIPNILQVVPESTTLPPFGSTESIHGYQSRSNTKLIRSKGDDTGIEMQQ